MKNPATKGIVVKVTEQHIVLLCEGGVFRNVPRQTDEVPKIGQTYTERQARKKRFAFSQVAAVAVLFFLIFASYSFFASNKAEAAYVVAIDINPKVEVYADKHLHVLKVKAMNDDGQRIKDSLQIDGHSLYDVVRQIIQSSISKGYLPRDQKGLITTTIIPLQKHLKPIDDQIKESIQQPLQEQSVNAKVYVMSGNKELLNQARKENLSVNQLQFYKSLKSKGVSVTPNEIRGKSMKQLDTMQAEANQSRDVPEKPNQKQSGQSDSHRANGSSGKSEENQHKTSQSSPNTDAKHGDQGTKGGQTDQTNRDGQGNQHSSQPTSDSHKSGEGGQTNKNSHENSPENQDDAPSKSGAQHAHKDRGTNYPSDKGNSQNEEDQNPSSVDTNNQFGQQNADLAQHHQDHK